MKGYTPGHRIENTAAAEYTDLLFLELEAYRGGAVMNAGGELAFFHTAYCQNAAEDLGGAIFNNAGVIRLADAVVFEENRADCAGAVFNGSSSLLEMQGGMLRENQAQFSGGAMENWGSLEGTEISFIGNRAVIGGTIYNGGKGSIALSNCCFSGNCAEASGGAIENYASVSVQSSVFADNAVLERGGTGGAIDNLEGSLRLVDVRFQGNSALGAGGAIYNAAGASLLLENVSFCTESDTVWNDGALTLSGTIVLGARLDSSTVIQADGATVVFDIRLFQNGNSKTLLGDFSRMAGKVRFGLYVGENQSEGVYALGEGAAVFPAGLTLSCGEWLPMSLSPNQSRTYHGSSYTLLQAGGSLSVRVDAYQAVAGAGSLSWGKINDASVYVLELLHGARRISVQAAGERLELLGLPEGDYTWRVRNAVENDNWQPGAAFSQTAKKTSPQCMQAQADGIEEFMFATAENLWGGGYQAQHVGTRNGWSGTGETLELAGKQRVTDVFCGSEDHTALYLYGGDGLPQTGLYLGLDDLFSGWPSSGGGEEFGRRLSDIQEIHAGNGDDIVDLTSQRFFFDGGVTVYGGAGDDVIWANSGENVLLGEDGGDRLVGACGDDVLAGGAGNDSMLGGGGRDIFAFGSHGWGMDTVQQLPEGSMLLWFAEGVARNDLTLQENAQGEAVIARHGGDSIALSGVEYADILENWNAGRACLSGGIELRFGDDGSAVYAQLASMGVFEA